jgi:hypothetical protein
MIRTSAYRETIFYLFCAFVRVERVGPALFVQQ